MAVVRPRAADTLVEFLNFRPTWVTDAVPELQTLWLAAGPFN